MLTTALQQCAGISTMYDAISKQLEKDGSSSRHAFFEASGSLVIDWAGGSRPHMIGTCMPGVSRVLENSDPLNRIIIPCHLCTEGASATQ
jgi:hypothetical protein